MQAQCVYLSPHLDDAVFSCGGRIWQQRDRSQVLVVTVFAGAPAPNRPLSAYAQQLHARWGAPANAVRERQAENRSALDVLGARAVHWPYLDCIYRQAPDGHFPYASEEALWGEIHATEKALIEELASRIAGLPLGAEGALFIPLGIGRHVDHRIVRRAAEKSGQPVIYYEDFPYSEDPAAVEMALADGPWQMAPVPLSEEALEAKLDAMARYRSQISSFWADVEAMERAVRASAVRAGDGEPAERYWRRPWSPPFTAPETVQRT